MASGVSVDDRVVASFNDMKVRKHTTTEETKKRKKGLIFCLSPDNKSVIIEEGKQLLVGDCDQGKDPYKLFIDMFPKDDCRYGLYDASFETKESKKEELVFIFWAPDNACLKHKMIYASTKDALKKKMPGIKHEYQANSYEDVEDRCNFALKVGGPTVISLEGRPI